MTCGAFAPRSGFRFLVALLYGLLPHSPTCCNVEGVPTPSRIVEVNGVEVKTKQDIIGQLKVAGAGPVVFTFLAKVTKTATEKAEELMEEGERLFAEKNYEEAMSVLIDAGNLDPENMKIQQSYTKVREAVWAFQPQQASTEIVEARPDLDSDDDDDDDDDDSDDDSDEEEQRTLVALSITKGANGYGMDITSAAQVPPRHILCYWH